MAERSAKSAGLSHGAWQWLWIVWRLAASVTTATATSSIVKWSKANSTSHGAAEKRASCAELSAKHGSAGKTAVKYSVTKPGRIARSTCVPAREA